MHDVEKGWLGDHGEVRLYMFDELGHAEHRVFLIDRAGHRHVGAPSRLFTHQSSEAAEHRGHTTLDVAGTAAKELVAFDVRAERWNDHAVDGDGVLVGFEKQSAFRAGHLETGDDV